MYVVLTVDNLYYGGPLPTFATHRDAWDWAQALVECSDCGEEVS
jgi:hypothetical protein